MSLTIDSHWGIPALLLAALCAAFTLLLLARVHRRNLSRRWRLACLILPGIAAASSALALGGLVLHRQARAREVVILLDLSGSTRGAPWRDPAWVRTLATRRLPANIHATVLGFAQTVHPLVENVSPADPARWPTEWPPIDGDAHSNLAAALAWRSPAEARGDQPRAPRWLITDGLTDPASIIPDAVTILPPTQIDVAITDLARRDDGQLWARCRATGPTAAALEFQCDGRPFAQQQIAFDNPAGGSRWVAVRNPQSPADAAQAHRYEVLIHRLPHPDPWPENDRAAILWQPADSTRVLVVHGDPAIALHLPAAAEITPDQLPSSASALAAAGWQVIVLDNLPLAAADGPAAALSARQAALLDAFVRDTGGGLLLAGTTHAFGPGGYDDPDAPLAALSPVYSQRHDRPPAHILFLLDASASMNESVGPARAEQKFRLAARGVEAAARILLPDDRVTLITFNDTAAAIADGALGSLQSTLPQQLAAVHPAGTTTPDAALPLVRAALANIPPHEQAFLILLTDGEVPAIDIGAWTQTLQSQQAALTIIAPPSPNAAPLAQLARAANAAWLPATDPERWPTLLREALAAHFLGHARTDPLTWRSWDPHAPPLTGVTCDWAEVWPKPDATTIVDAPNATLAAIAQRGLGKVAALALRDPSAAGDALLHRVLHDIRPAPGDRRFSLSAHRDGERWRIMADGLDEEIFLNGEHLQWRTATADVPMRQTGPGHYEARTDGHEGGTGVVIRAADVQADADGGAAVVGRLRTPQVATTEWPASVERDVPANFGDTKALSGDTMGERWQPQLRNRMRLPLTPIFWLVTAIAALFALLIRRSR